jgi:hypothetical protein
MAPIAQAAVILLGCGLAIVPISGGRAGVAECGDAVEEYNSALSELESALRSYARCVSDSQGHDDCSLEFSTLQSAQDDFESAVSNYQTECE